MREFTKAELEKLALAGNFCYSELLSDLAAIDTDKSTVAFDEAKIRAAEAAAWQDLAKTERRAQIKRLTVVAACLLIVAGVAALSAKPAVANKKLWPNLFVKDNGTYMEIVSNAAAMVPDGWDGCYVPMEIPQGYRIESAENLDTMCGICYVNDADNYITFNATLGEYAVHMDTENCEMNDIQIGDKQGVTRVKYKNGEIAYYSVAWYDDNEFFSLSSDALDIQILTSIAESVMIYTQDSK